MNYAVKDCEIKEALKEWRWDGVSVEEGKVMLVELMIKAQNGCYNSHTEEGFLSSMKVLKKGRKINARGFGFLLKNLYRHSNNISDFAKYSVEFRKNELR